jgi:hypothetical protein
MKWILYMKMAVFAAAVIMCRVKTEVRRGVGGYKFSNHGSGVRSPTQVGKKRFGWGKGRCFPAPLYSLLLS